MYLPWILLVPGIASAVLYTVVLVSFLTARLFARPAAPAPSRLPKVSVLKPLAGVDDDLWDNLVSFTAIDYPDFEILLGVASWTDKAAPLARRFKAAYPSVRIKVVRTDPRAATNPKVAQLIGLEARAKGEIVVISDSNVRVAPDYLRRVVAELSQPGVGLTSNLFIGTGERSLGAMLENLQLCASILPTLVAASRIAGRVLTIGKSMAMWRAPLRALGGFAEVASILAEDHVLGRRFEDAGFRVTLCRSFVENRNTSCGLRRTYERHARWAKMRRGVAPRAWTLELMMIPVVVSLATWVVWPCRQTGGLVLVAAMLQMLGAAICTRVVRRRWDWWTAPLELLRSLVLAACWASSVVSRRVEWRGHPFLVLRDSRIVPAPTRSWPRLRALRRAWAVARA
jgi:ceramide glucosyltransferase